MTDNLTIASQGATSPPLAGRARGRRVWLALHRWIGLICGALFALVGLTGSALVFWQPLDEALYPMMKVAPPHNGAAYTFARRHFPGREGRDASPRRGYIHRHASQLHSRRRRLLPRAERGRRADVTQDLCRPLYGDRHRRQVDQNGRRRNAAGSDQLTDQPASHALAWLGFWLCRGNPGSAFACFNSLRCLVVVAEAEAVAPRLRDQARGRRGEAAVRSPSGVRRGFRGPSVPVARFRNLHDVPHAGARTGAVVFSRSGDAAPGVPAGAGPADDRAQRSRSDRAERHSARKAAFDLIAGEREGHLCRRTADRRRAKPKFHAQQGDDGSVPARRFSTSRIAPPTPPAKGFSNGSCRCIRAKPSGTLAV